MTRFILWLCLSFPFLVFAEGDEQAEKKVKYGELTASETWSGDIYLVGDVIVPEGMVLTIAAGTRIFFAEYDVLASGNDEQQTEILVGGDLHAESTEEQPILVATIGDPQWKKITNGDKSVQIEFKPYLIDTEAMRKEFHQFKKQYIILWTLIYVMWILAL